MRRLLLLSAAFLVFIAIAVPSAVVYYVIFTQSGFQFIVRHIPHRFGDTTLDIVNPTGSIAYGIHVDRVVVDHHLVNVRVENIGGHVKLLPLLWQTIHSPDAFIGKVTVAVKKRDRPPTASEPLFVPSWMVINADHTHIGLSIVTVYNGFHLEATDIDGSAVIRHRTIRFYEIQGQISDTHVAGKGLLHATDPFGIDVDTRINWSPSDQPAWAGTVAARGNLASLGLVIHTTQPFRADFNGRALDLTNRWHWLGDAVAHDIDIRVWGGSGVLGLITGHATIHGDTHGFGGTGTADPTGLKVGLFQTEFDGYYTNHVLTARHMSARHIVTGAFAAGAGTIEVMKGGPRLDLQGNWHDFRWPLVGKDKDVPFHSPSGQYTLKGIMPYDVHLDGIGKVLDYPLMPAKVDGSLGKDFFNWSRAEVDLFQGHASVNGSVTWAPKNTWSVSGRLTGIDPSYFRPDLPGKLDFTLAVVGKSFEPTGDTTIDFSDLGGRLRGALVSGGGQLFHSGNTLEFDNIRVGLGHTNIALDGRIDNQANARLVDLRFNIAAEDLSLLAADSRGQLKAAGTVRGTLDDPKIVVSAHGSDIRHNGIGLEHIDADIDFDSHADHESKIDARLHNLTYNSRTFESLAFTLSGKPANYVMRLDLQALGLAAKAEASGPFSQGIFNGQLRTLAINGTQSLHLELERPVALRFSRGEARIDWMCLVGTPVSVCADANWKPDQWSATMTANQLPISSLTAGMTPSVDYQGTININARASQEGNQLVQGTARLELTDAQLSHKLLSHRIEHTTLGSGVISITATQSALTAEAKLEDGQIGTISANFDAQRNTPEWQNMPVHGGLHAHTAELNLISLYMPDIDRAAGELTADVRIAGTFGTPLLDGTVKIANGEVDFYQVNLGLRQLGMEARLTDNGLNFNGAARIGSGTATADGQLEWHDSLPHGKFTLKGDNLRVVDVPEAQIDASPDLEFNVDGRKIDVTGSVKIPNAKIEPKDLTGAVRASSDEIIVGTEIADPAKRFEVMTSVALVLGNQVSIKTSGLTGRLTGNITVRSGYDAITRATGELSIEEGKYVAYAHSLDITRGRLMFTGGPVDDPGIDIRAIHKFPDVTAGVNVRGTLLQPHLSFFSEPSLAQAEIVSLLLSGSPLAGTTAATRTNGVAANNTAIAEGGAILAQQLGQHVGIQEVGVESDLLTNDTSLVLGRYLSPRLYVSYGVSLTENLNVLKLRYSLGDHWVVRTEVGQARGADLLYTIDK